MPFQKGNTLSKGRTKGPEKKAIYRWVLTDNAIKLAELSMETGWTEGDLLDMLIQRANVSNIRRKK